MLVWFLDVTKSNGHLLGFLAELIISLILTLSFVVLNSALKESMVSVKRSFCELTSVNNSGTTFVPFFLRFTTQP